MSRSVSWAILSMGWPVCFASSPLRVSLIQFYAPNDVFDCPLNINRAEVQAEFGDEKDDLSDMSDEEIRQAIYELEDTTMLRLGQMTREELEKEYDGIEVDMDE